MVRLLLLAVAIAVAGCRPAGGGSAEAGAIAISRAAVSAPPADAPAPAFLVIENHGSAPDTLLGVTSPDADSVVLHTMVGGQMQPVPSLAIPAGARVRLHPGAYHLMLEGLRRPLAVGDTVTLRFRFAEAGQIPVRTPVLRYSEAVRR
jgi:copper(I)-binding protein